ncbi:MAG: Asp/Glu racemase [Sulfitobacter sp.]|nr:Asp/Glu racemase [Sulfitobacter sp.]
MTIHVINPNSLSDVTEGIDAAIAPMRAVSPVAIETHTLSEGPPGIETAAHIAQVVAPLTKRVEDLTQGASAFVVACYSDPGVAALRETVWQPVIGIGEAAVLTAMQRGARFGTISIQPGSIPRHMAALGVMGVATRCAGDLALSLSVRELSDAQRTEARLRKVGTALRDAHGADVLILACAGMARYRADLEEELGLPVIDPCQAATAMAIAAVALERAAGSKGS